MRKGSVQANEFPRTAVAVRVAAEVTVIRTEGVFAMTTAAVAVGHKTVLGHPVSGQVRWRFAWWNQRDGGDRLPF